MEGFIQNSWAEIALAILTAAGTITALTESKKDDRVVDVLKRIVNAVVLGRSSKRRKEQ
jgi:hypothetical protein